MTNKDLHTLYSIFDICNELTFSKPANRDGLDIMIDDVGIPVSKENRYIISQNIYTLDLRPLCLFIFRHDVLNIFRCKDDNALKFRLLLPLPGDSNLKVHDSIIIDDVPENEDHDICMKVLVSMKARMAAKIIHVLDEDSAKIERCLDE